MDQEEVIRNAFGCFDPEHKKIIGEDQLKSILTTMGSDKMTEEEVDDFFAAAPFDAAGNFQYTEFIHVLQHGGRKA
jgi:Ca2+-binding EF-hand superfamily protein